MRLGHTPPRSLKARALQWLAQREHSRTELRRKLMRLAVADGAVADGAAACAGSTPAGAAGVDGVDGEHGAPQPPEPAARVDALLDWLEAHQYLSQERFVESRVHARLARFGNLRIRHELKQHQVALPDDTARELADTEVQRARAVRERKFTDPPANATERARQGRFLAGRGFSPEVIQRVLREPAQAVDDAEVDSGDA